MQHRRRTGSRRCWDRQSARACSWCRWMRCAAGGATATCSPTCCAPVCRRNSLAGCRNYTGPPPGQTSTVWPMTRCGRRGGHRERRGRRELGWARELADLALDEEGHRRPAASRPRRPGPGRWADQPGPFDRAARYLGGRRRMPVPEHAEIALYRTAGETLQNVVKHAQAGRVQVKLPCDGGHAFLRVSTTAAASPPRPARTGGLGGSYGLRSMTERAELVGGRLEVSSRPGGGTTVTAVVRPDRGNRARRHLVAGGPGWAHRCSTSSSTAAEACRWLTACQGRRSGVCGTASSTIRPAASISATASRDTSVTPRPATAPATTAPLEPSVSVAGSASSSASSAWHAARVPSRPPAAARSYPSGPIPRAGPPPPAHCGGPPARPRPATAGGARL